MTDIDYDAIEARAAAAIKGPWYVAYSDWEDEASIRQNESPRLRDSYVEVAATQQCSDDHSPTAEFIAHARTDVSALLAALRERDATIARVREELARHEEYLPTAVDYDCCGRCNSMTGGYVAWPCPTYTLLRAALDPQEGQ